MDAQNKVKTINKAKGRVVALLVGLSLVVLFEAGLWLVGVGPDDALFVASDSSYRINPQTARRFFPRQYVRLAPGQDRFARDKDARAFRVFALGASTLLGFPNPAYTSFPNFLQQMLADAYPERGIEVVNCGVTAINSFVVREFVEEVVEHEPDLVSDLRWPQRVRGAVRGRDSICAPEWQLVLHPVADVFATDQDLLLARQFAAPRRGCTASRRTR